jgi:hypothetical protein
MGGFARADRGERAAHVRTRDPPPNRLPGPCESRRFCGVSLEAWEDRCQPSGRGANLCKAKFVEQLAKSWLIAQGVD